MRIDEMEGAFVSKLSNEKRAPGCLGFIGDYTIQLYGDYKKKTIIRIPIKQPVFHGKSTGFFFRVF